MGLFHEQVEVINRTSKRLNVRFDGQDIELDPNYTAEGKLIPDVRNYIPTVTVDYAKSQNVLMGSEDAQDPSSYDVLVGVKAKKGEKQRDEIGYLEQDETVLTRVRLEELLDDPNAKIIISGRKVKMSDARPKGNTAPFEPKVS